MAIISMAELATFLGIPDSEDNPNLTTAVAAANQAIIEYCGRTFDKTATAAASARVYYPCDQLVCDVDDFWETTALAVTVDTGDDGTYETTWTLTTDFFVLPLNGLQHGQAWPYTKLLGTGTKSFPATGYRPSVRVTAAWGWTAIPPAVKQATLIKGARLFKRNLSPEGVLSGFADFGAIRVSNREDPDVIDLCAPFRTPLRALLVA